MGKLEDGDTCEQAVEKIQNALKGRGNRTAAVHKLFCSMVQANQTFDAWHKKVYEDQGGGPGGQVAGRGSTRDQGDPWGRGPWGPA